MKFRFKAFKDNKIIEKKINAESEASVLSFLKENQYFPIEIKKVDNESFSQFSAVFDRANFNDVVTFTRQIAIMLNAGLTLIDSLAILRKQTTKQSYLHLLEDIDKEIRSGNSLSDALNKHRNLFSNLYIALVKSGEASGKLNEILSRLADNLEKQREFRGKITSALIYPVIIIISMVGVMFVMVTFVIPKLLNLYKDFNIELPFTTKILIAISSILTKTWPIILILLFVSLPLIKKIADLPPVRYKIDYYLLRLPLFGRIIQMAALVDSTRTLAILTNSGISILDSLSIVTDISENVIYKKTFENIYKQIEKGGSLGEAFERAEIFPPILVQMVTVGEETGHLDETLNKISRYFEMESEIAVKAATSMVEPLILVVLGLGVGFLVMSVITPIYNLTTSFK
jgi:type IV pilus assembly protein PilC